MCAKPFPEISAAAPATSTSSRPRSPQRARSPPLPQGADITMMLRGCAIWLAALALVVSASLPAQSAEELTVLATVTRVVNVPMIVGLRLLEKQDGVKVTVKDRRSPEAVMLAVIEGQGQVATGFAPFYPAVEKGAPVKAVIELSRPEFVVMAKKEIASVKDLNGVRLASHSPKATVQSL